MSDLDLNEIRKGFILLFGSKTVSKSGGVIIHKVDHLEFIIKKGGG